MTDLVVTECRTEEMPVPLSVEYPKPSERPKRTFLKLPKSLSSPYLTEIRRELTQLRPLDREVAEFVFADGLDLEEVLYTSPSISLRRSALRTMQRGEWLNSGVIDAWAHEMNRHAQNVPMQPKRQIFFSTLHTSVLNAETDLYNASLAEEMKAFGISPDHIGKADLIFLPIAWSAHFYLAVYNIQARKIEVIDNKPLPKGIPFDNKYGVLAKVSEMFLGFLSTVKPARAKMLSKFTPTVVKMPWQDNTNDVDCGVFCMRHMQTYFGDHKKWDCGLTRANGFHKLHFWRMHYLSTILLSGNNSLKWLIEFLQNRMKLRNVQ